MLLAKCIRLCRANHIHAYEVSAALLTMHARLFILIQLLSRMNLLGYSCSVSAMLLQQS